MRFSFVALAGLIALGNNLGVQAQVAPDDVVLSTSRATHARDANEALVTLDDERLKGRSPAFAPVAAKPPARVPLHDDGPDVLPPARNPTDGNVKDGDKDRQPVRMGTEQKPKPKPANLCFRPGKRSRIDRRGGPPWTHADLEDPKRMAEWLSTQSFDNTKAVFYVSGPYGEPEVGDPEPNQNGKTMAENFISNNPGKGYVRFQDLFDKNPNFENDFKFADYVEKNPSKDFMITGSKAMALWTKEGILFNSNPTDESKSPLRRIFPICSRRTDKIFYSG